MIEQRLAIAVLPPCEAYCLELLAFIIGHARFDRKFLVFVYSIPVSLFTVANLEPAFLWLSFSGESGAGKTEGAQSLCFLIFSPKFAICSAFQLPLSLMLLIQLG